MSKSTVKWSQSKGKKWHSHTKPPNVAEEVAEPELDENGEEKPPRPDPIETLARMHGELMAHLAKPKTIIRGPDGRAVGVQ